jgi:valyl-tRNA synthetase
VEDSAYVVARSEDAARQIAQERLGHENFSLRQDEDVLDTWFSSGLWPFATVGWPAQTAEYERFYPAACLETGYDILFFWVARMVMMGLELTDKSPFHTIYMHGLVRSSDGQKMSKTKGNVIDPLDAIGQYGCDALRYSLVTGSSPGQDVPLSMERIEANRNFANKLWNVGKYLQNALKDVEAEEYKELASGAAMSQAELSRMPFAERYIISRCHSLIDDVTESLERYETSP